MIKKIILICLITLFIISCTPSTNLPPEPPAPGETEGGALAGKAIAADIKIDYDLYAKPQSFTLLSNEIFVKPTEQITAADTDWEETKRNVLYALVGVPPMGASPGEYALEDIQEDVVYHIGYIDNGDNPLNPWKEFEFTGDQSDSNWFIQAAGAAIPVNYQDFKIGNNYILAYACKIMSEPKATPVCQACSEKKDEDCLKANYCYWNCHGDKWMIHRFTVYEYCEVNEDCLVGLCKEEKCVALPQEPTTPAVEEDVTAEEEPIEEDQIQDLPDGGDDPIAAG